MFTGDFVYSTEAIFAVVGRIHEKNFIIKFDRIEKLVRFVAMCRITM